MHPLRCHPRDPRSVSAAIAEIDCASGWSAFAPVGPGQPGSPLRTGGTLPGVLLAPQSHATPDSGRGMGETRPEPRS